MFGRRIEYNRGQVATSPQQHQHHSHTQQLKNWFDLLGWPQTIRSDGGPQYRTEFDQFSSKCNIKHKLTSPRNPQANGLAESSVKNVKHLLLRFKQSKQNFQTALACYRNTPRAHGYSPAQLFRGRWQQTTMPLTLKQWQPVDQEELKRAVQPRVDEIRIAEQYERVKSKTLDKL